MNSDAAPPSDTEPSEADNVGSLANRGFIDTSDVQNLEGNQVETQLDDALERVVHGAVISVPSLLINKGIGFLFTVLLTNGFGATTYGIFILANRIEGYLVNVIGGFGNGIHRFLPEASTEERDMIVTFAGLVMMVVAIIFGTGLFIAAPLIRDMTTLGSEFQLFVRIFAIGLPTAVWLLIVIDILRALEDISLLNLAHRVGQPTVKLGIAGLGTLVFYDLVFVAVGMVLNVVLISLTLTGWLVRRRGFNLRLGGLGVVRIRRRYMQFTVPIFALRFMKATRRLGFYPLIAIYLSGVAGGVFAVGLLLGSLVGLPLTGINQLFPPVAATLHKQGHREALRRLYQVTTRLMLVGVTGLAIPIIVYREAVLSLFGPTFVNYASLLPIFIFGEYISVAAGSVSTLLMMTDNQRPLLAVNVIITMFMVVTAFPLTITFGLQGLVISYLLLNAVGQGLEMAILYRLEDLQPLTPLHAKPLLAAVPLLLICLSGRMVLSAARAPLIGSLVGLSAYISLLYMLGFTFSERRLIRSLVSRYREKVPSFT